MCHTSMRLNVSHFTRRCGSVAMTWQCTGSHAAVQIHSREPCVMCCPLSSVLSVAISHCPSPSTDTVPVPDGHCVTAPAMERTRQFHCPHRSHCTQYTAVHGTSHMVPDTLIPRLRSRLLGLCDPDCLALRLARRLESMLHDAMLQC